jgi:flavin reductase (DIM6/NTAB) family NADH-FMN oxidoreductase RutF
MALVGQGGRFVASVSDETTENQNAGAWQSHESDRSELPLADRESVRQVHRRFPTGVMIVTTAVDNTPFGLALNAFTSISLEPPLVLVAIAATAATHPNLFLSNQIGINILAAGQESIVHRFARSGGDKFASVAWHQGRHGAPLLDGVAAHLEMETAKRIAAYTHTLFVGKVLRAEAFDRQPLVFLGGKFYRTSSLRPVDGGE